MSYNGLCRVQDPEDGGIADRPDNVTDVFHTVFGCAGKYFSFHAEILGKG